MTTRPTHALLVQLLREAIDIVDGHDDAVDIRDWLKSAQTAIATIDRRPRS